MALLGLLAERSQLAPEAVADLLIWAKLQTYRQLVLTLVSLS